MRSFPPLIPVTSEFAHAVAMIKPALSVRLLSSSPPSLVHLTELLPVMLSSPECPVQPASSKYTLYVFRFRSCSPSDLCVFRIFFFCLSCRRFLSVSRISLYTRLPTIAHAKHHTHTSPVAAPCQLPPAAAAHQLPPVAVPCPSPPIAIWILSLF